jgi:hypothetical protein
MSRNPADEDGDEALNPWAVREWLAEERERLCEHLAAEGELENPDPQPAWWFAPHVIVWALGDGWALGGSLPTHYVVGNDTLGSPRDAARYFVRQFRERARRLESPTGRTTDESRALTRWAEALMMSVRQDDGWPEELPGNEPPAELRARAMLKGSLFKTATDPDLAPVLRILHRCKDAPGGEHYGIYFYFDVERIPAPRVFDALARRIVEIDTQFAPLVAHRVQYALVYFGINFGNHAQEIEAERQADQMRARNVELSQRIDSYGAKDGDLLPIHFVDDTDQPFTAHPCLGSRDPGRAYVAEATYFNCRDQPFHKQLEASPLVAMRLLAASIDPDVIEEARQAFAG